MSSMSRRDLLRTAGAGAALLTLPSVTLADDPPAKSGGFTLPPLPYAFDALEPHIDAKTMEIHHDRHHKAYVDNLNKALAGTEWANKPIEEVLKNISSMPEDKQVAVTNNGGGHYNHSMFWQIMAKNGGKPSDEFMKAWGGDFDSLKKAVKETGLGQFGSGWAWVVWIPSEKKLSVAPLPNQDCPVSRG